MEFNLSTKGLSAEQYDFELVKSANAFASAKIRNLDIVVPRENQLQIDIDSEEDYWTYKRSLVKFKLHVAEVLNEESHPSPSGGLFRLHITLDLNKDLEVEERILYQLMLGSDRTREILSYVRFMNNDPTPTLFFEKRQKLLNAGPTEYAGDNS